MDRFIARTERPLPEGLCGGPTLDSDGNVCGIIEGIAPLSHRDEKLAGAASGVDVKKAYTLEQVQTMLATVEREKEEAMDILKKEGGDDVDEIVERVRRRTRERQMEIRVELEKEKKAVGGVGGVGGSSSTHE